MKMEMKYQFVTKLYTLVTLLVIIFIKQLIMEFRNLILVLIILYLHLVNVRVLSKISYLFNIALHFMGRKYGLYIRQISLRKLVLDGEWLYLRRIWNLPVNTHCDILLLVSSQGPIEIHLNCRFFIGLF